MRTLILLLVLLFVAPSFQQVQYTPNQADWSLFNQKFRLAGFKAHDPNSFTLVTAAQWEAAKWDGRTTYNPRKMTKEAFHKALCPTDDTLRGLREVFYRLRPFKDNANPTKAEVDRWHMIGINHVRDLVGYTASNRKIQPDKCLFARALWGDQRKYTRMWDQKYPTDTCVGTKNSHCGATFMPSPADQSPYVGTQTCTAGAGAEGIFVGSKSFIPWSVKWVRSFCSNLGREGFWGGHTGPWFHRSLFGFSFWDDPNFPQEARSVALLRAKWGGTLMDPLYPAPTAMSDEENGLALSAEEPTNNNNNNDATVSSAASVAAPLMIVAIVLGAVGVVAAIVVVVVVRKRSSQVV